MPQEEGIPAPQPEIPRASASSPVEPGTSNLLKNIGAFVTILTALAGIGFTAYQLRLKAVADKEAATQNQAAEKDKLDLGISQLKDQAEARHEQTEQHREDNRLAFENHRLDNERLKATADDADAKENSKRLSDLITHMFSGHGTAEGDIAALSEFLDKDQSSVQIVENAVLARLENPQSREEIDLGFRILESIGMPAIDVTLQANRSARQKYDDCTFAKFYDVVIEKSKPVDAKGQYIPFDMVDSAEYEVAGSQSVDHRYIFATINRILQTEQKTDPRLPAQPPVAQCPQQYASTVMERSNTAVMRQFRSTKFGVSRRPEFIDFSGTYLSKSFLVLGASISYPYSLNTMGAFVPFDEDYPLRNELRNNTFPGQLYDVETTLLSLGNRPHSISLAPIKTAIPAQPMP